MNEFDNIIQTTAEIGVEVSVYRDNKVVDDFGDLKVRPGAGRSVVLDISADLSGIKFVVTIDPHKSVRARKNLDVAKLVEGLGTAAKVDGVSEPFPEAS